MDIRRSAAWLLGIGFGGTVVVAFCILAYFAGPAIEAYFFPPVKSDLVAGTVRLTEGQLCWTTHIKRLRNGLTPAYFNYRLYYKGDVIPLNAWRIGPSGKKVWLANYGFSTHNRGDEWDVEYCSDIPHEIKPTDKLYVEGDGSFDPWHHLWRLEISLPGFAVNS